MGILRIQRLLWVIAIAIPALKFRVQSLQCPYPPPAERPVGDFVQLTDRFWAYDSDSKQWKRLELPFDLLSCINDSCIKVGSIEDKNRSPYDHNLIVHQEDASDDENLNLNPHLPLRTRTSLRAISESSVWITGESGSIYERFWNGIQWVIAPHDLPASAGYAISVFAVKETFMALSEAGVLYQLTVDANTQPVWVETGPSFPSTSSIDNSVEDSNRNVRLRSGIPSADGTLLYFATEDGSLVELSELHPVKWINHGRPRGGDVAAIVDAGTLRSEVIFTVSTIGELYEFDTKSRPSWKKHIWGKSSTENISLAPSRGCTLHSLVGASSASLLLLSKDGLLLERQLFQRKWKWFMHTTPKNISFSALGPTFINETFGTKTFSIFLTTKTGLAYEYQLPKLSGAARGNGISEKWINHGQPQDAKVARSIPGVLLQAGRILFALDDGRLGELHLSGIGGEDVGPYLHNMLRKKALASYEWSIIDAPESEGGNAGYCTEAHGPSNCIEGVRDALDQDDATDFGISSKIRRRKGRIYQSHSTGHKTQNHALHFEINETFLTINNIGTLFRIRAMQPDRSFFLVTDSGMIFEHLYNENLWLWLKHDHSSPIRGVLGVYNGSLFVVDDYGHLFIRERDSSGLIWVNCSAMEGGRQVALGPPWDAVHGQDRKATKEDALFFVSRSGSLLQFTVALRKFVWQDCGQPQNTQVAFILDQELLRYNVVFVVGKDGRLYQYNRVSRSWYEHDQAPHLVLSSLPGVVVRPSFMSMSGSLFMRSEDGGLVEFHWHTMDGWRWTVHGIPEKDVDLSTAPGPSFEGNQLFVIGSNGQVYSRYLDGKKWKWKGFGSPLPEILNIFPIEDASDIHNREWKSHSDYKEDIKDFPYSNQLSSNPEATSGSQHIYFIDIDCDEKVAPVRPVPFSRDSVLFMLRDGRLAELRKTEDGDWKWIRIINTPTSHCRSSYVTASTS